MSSDLQSSGPVVEQVLSGVRLRLRKGLGSRVQHLLAPPGVNLTVIEDSRFLQDGALLDSVEWRVLRCRTGGSQHRHLRPQKWGKENRALVLDGGEVIADASWGLDRPKEKD